MILTKLQEALDAIPAQRKALDEVEMQIRSMIAKLTGLPNPLRSDSGTVLHSAIYETGSLNRIDQMVGVLRAVGHPLHINAICERLSDIHGTSINRTEVEPGLNRHIAKTKIPKIVKVAPSTYGLPEWKARSMPAA